MQLAGQLIRRHSRLIGVIALLLLLFALFEWSGLRDQFTLAYLQQTIRAHLISGLLIFILGFTLGNLIQIPGWIFLAAAVLALGELWGGIATYIAACIACFVTFFTIRSVGGNALRNIDHPIAYRLLDRLDAHPIRSIVLLRMLFQTMPALNYTLAMSGVRFRAYAIGTLLGLPLPIAAYCVFFDSLARVLGIA
ncbi:MAG: VTT domain-containing protein [Thiobacillus sp.]|nr:VTT domain-containing protein [Thiobacillus sp.]